MATALAELDIDSSDEEQKNEPSCETKQENTNTTNDDDNIQTLAAPAFVFGAAASGSGAQPFAGGFGAQSKVDESGDEEWIYVLKLEDDCIYVGKTKHPSNRLEHHRNRNGSAWTRLHPPIDFLVPPRKVENSSEGGLEEDKETKKWMTKKGIQFVRGGAYSQCVLPPAAVFFLQREQWHNAGACNRCGRKGHWVTKCIGTTDVNGMQLAPKDGAQEPRPNSFAASTDNITFGSPAPASSFGTDSFGLGSATSIPKSTFSFGSRPSTTSGTAVVCCTRDEDGNAGYRVTLNQLKVIEINRNCIGFANGLRNNQRVTHVDGHPVSNWDEYRDRAHGRDTFQLTVIGGSAAPGNRPSPVASAWGDSSGERKNGRDQKGSGGPSTTSSAFNFGSPETKEVKKKTGVQYKVIKVQAEEQVGQLRAIKIDWTKMPTTHGTKAFKAYAECAEALQQEVQEAVDEGFLPHGNPTHAFTWHFQYHDKSGNRSIQHFMTQAMQKGSGGRLNGERVTFGAHGSTRQRQTKNSVLQYKIIRVSAGLEGVDQPKEGLILCDDPIGGCVQETERQVQAAIEEGFIPKGPPTWAPSQGGFVVNMTQEMIKYQ